MTTKSRLEGTMNISTKLTDILGRQIPAEVEGRKLFAEIQLTSDQAGQLLEYRTRRFLRQTQDRTVKAYAKDFSGNAWLRDNQLTIGQIAGQDGFFLADGNHRITALSSVADVAIPFDLKVIEFDDDQSAFRFCELCVDRNRPRDTVDKLEINGAFANLDALPNDYKKAFSSMVQFLMVGMKGRGGGQDKPPSIAEIRSAFDDLHEYAYSYYKKVSDSKPLKSALLLRPFFALGTILYRSAPEPAEDFFADIVGGKNTVEVLKAEVLTPGGRAERTPEVLFRAAVACWNSYREHGRVLQWEEIVLQLAEAENWQKAKPVIAGTAFNGDIEKYSATENGPSILSPTSNWTARRDAENG